MAYSCIACAPETFSDASGTTPRQLVGSAQAQCKALGIDTTVDFSPLDNIGGGDNSNNGEAEASGTENGLTPVDDTEQEEQGNGNTGAVSKTPVEEAPAPSRSTEAPVEEETTKSASFTPAKTSAAAVASPAPTGAGVVLKAQDVFIPIVAAGLGVAYFLL